MTKKEPLLSICIPTYNREKYLKRLLDSIVSQKKFTDTDDVEIIVDDGPSTDNTETMVKDYIKIYWSKIKYYRNLVRIWMCPAFLEALDLWTWKYLWLMWSDDFMNFNALKSILKCIDKYNFKVAYSRRKEINFWEQVEDTKGKLEISFFSWMTNFSVYLWDTNLWTFHDKDVFFTFISVLCINRDYYRESYNVLIKKGYLENELKKNYFNFSLVALWNIKDNDILCVINNPICVYCEDSNMWRIPGKKVCQDLGVLIRYIKNNYKISRGCKKFFRKQKFMRYLSNESKTFKFVIKLLKKVKLYKIFKWIYNFLRFWKSLQKKW